MNHELKIPTESHFFGANYLKSEFWTENFEKKFLDFFKNSKSQNIRLLTSINIFVIILALLNTVNK